MELWGLERVGLGVGWVSVVVRWERMVAQLAVVVYLVDCELWVGLVVGFLMRTLVLVIYVVAL